LIPVPVLSAAQAGGRTAGAQSLAPPVGVRARPRVFHPSTLAGYAPGPSGGGPPHQAGMSSTSSCPLRRRSAMRRNVFAVVGRWWCARRCRRSGTGKYRRCQPLRRPDGM